MAVLPGVLGCRPLRRTVQVRLGTNPAVPRDGYQVARPSSSRSLRSAQSRKRVPSFVVSRQQLKLPAVRLRRTGNLRNVRYLFHFIVVRSLTPQPRRRDFRSAPTSYGECARWSIFKRWGPRPTKMVIFYHRPREFSKRFFRRVGRNG